MKLIWLNFNRRVLYNQLFNCSVIIIKCVKIRLFNFHFKVLIIWNTIKVNILPNVTKFLMNQFCVPLLFRRHVCLSNLKHAPSQVLPLTARQTVFSHLKSQGIMVSWGLNRKRDVGSVGENPGNEVDTSFESWTLGCFVLSKRIRP